MEIYPQDLGLRRQTALVRRRGAMASGMQTASTSALNFDLPPHRPLGPLGRFWMHGVDADPQAKQATLEANRPGIVGFVGGFCGGSTGFFLPALLIGLTGHEPVVGIVMAALGTVFCGLGLTLPGTWLRGVHRKPVTGEEFDALKAAAGDDALETSYVRLAREMAAQNVADNAGKSLREALRALGEAIDALPHVPAADADTNALRLDADRARAEAGREPDAVAAASLRRRADALDRSARAASQSEALRRRAAVLRDELLAQTESLRLGLAAARPDSGEVAGLAALAESVRAVADEAAGVAAARAELDAALSPSVVAPIPADAPATLSLRAGQ